MTCKYASYTRLLIREAIPYPIKNGKAKTCVHIPKPTLSSLELYLIAVMLMEYMYTYTTCICIAAAHSTLFRNKRFALNLMQISEALIAINVTSLGLVI